MIQLVIFDMAGTTIDEDNLVYKTLRDALVAHGVGVDLPKVLELGAGKEKFQAIKDLLAEADLQNASDARIIFEDFRQRLAQAYAVANIDLQPGARELFEQLQARGVKVALNTGYDRKTAEQILERIGYLNHPSIDLLVTASEVSNGRPAPDMIFYAMDQLGISDADKVVKIGDSAVDIEEGRAAGCGFNLGITTGAQTKEQLLTAQPDEVLHHLNELIPYLVRQAQLVTA